MMSLKKFRDWCKRWAPELLAGLGLVIYLVQAWVYAHAQASVLDEGAYLYKGYLFATGQYTPYQDFGPRTNHMPLSFLIPGTIQKWFGPGLRVARYAAIVFSFSGLLAVWLMARRLAGRWWAVLGVLAFALNPSLIKMYSVATSQGLVFFFLAWSLFFFLGDDRKQWQLVVGAIFAGLLYLTRVNMSPILGLMAVYLVWRIGWRRGGYALAAGVLLVAIFHLAYWPNILNFYSSQVPLPAVVNAAIAQANPIATQTPKPTHTPKPTRTPGPTSTPDATKIWRATQTALALSTPVVVTLTPAAVVENIRLWDPEAAGATRIASFFVGFRAHFVALLGFLIGWAYLIFGRERRQLANEGALLFLLIAYSILVLIHTWSSLGQNYCVYCFESYLAFFDVIGISLGLLALTRWCAALSKYAIGLFAVIILLLLTLLGYGAAADVGSVLAAINVSRISLSGIQPGSMELWGLFANKFGLDYKTIVVILSTALGAGLGLVVLIAWYLAARITRQAEAALSGRTPFMILLIMSIVLSPTVMLGSSPRSYDCPGDVLASQEAVGAALQAVIPDGVQVYWRGSLSAVPLLYIPAASTYPAQINSNYTLHQGGNAYRLLVRGLWNDELSIRWIEEADYLLIGEEFIHGHLRSSTRELIEAIKSERFELVLTTPPLIDCRANGPIYVYQAVRP